MNISQDNFAGFNCLKLENQSLQLWVTQDLGPRVIGLQLHEAENLLAIIPHRQAVTPTGKTYHFHGGHRFWYAPEDPERTYLPDNSAVTIARIPNGIQTTQAVEPGTGIEKQISITLPDETTVVTLKHTLTNRSGETAVKLAPWAITQLKPGGFAILPQPTTDTGLLPNRRLALWPYTRLNSPHLQLGDDLIFVHAKMSDEKLKLGWANTAGWLAYWNAGTLFVKQADYDENADYFDFGSSSECYCDDDFLELETLGPVTTLAPGESVTHHEVWRVYPNVSFSEVEEKTVRETMSLYKLNGRH